MRNQHKPLSHKDYMKIRCGENVEKIFNMYRVEDKDRREKVEAYIENIFDSLYERNCNMRATIGEILNAFDEEVATCVMTKLTEAS